jgi:hypothetical protein
VYKLQNPGSRLKYKSFLLKVTDYWAGMILEGTHEEDDVEAGGEDDDPSPPAPVCTKKRSCWDTVRRHEGQLLELEKRNIHRNPAECVQLTKKH